MFLGCSPVKVWILSRHGTRLPVADELKQLRELTDVSIYIIYVQVLNIIHECISKSQFVLIN